MSQDVYTALVRRLGRRYAEQRLRIEEDHEAQIFGQGINFFHFENWYSSPWLIRNTLRLAGLYRRGLENAKRVELLQNEIALARLPRAFEGLTILHISDMHVDMNPGAMQSLIELVATLDYDICVLTGDYRGKTWGPLQVVSDGNGSTHGNPVPIVDRKTGRIVLVTTHNGPQPCNVLPNSRRPYNALRNRAP